MTSSWINMDQIVLFGLRANVPNANSVYWASVVTQRTLNIFVPIFKLVIVWNAGLIKNIKGWLVFKGEKWQHCLLPGVWTAWQIPPNCWFYLLSGWHLTGLSWITCCPHTWTRVPLKPELQFHSETSRRFVLILFFQASIKSSMNGPCIKTHIF